MDLKKVIPEPEAMLREIIIVGAGVIGFAFIVSRFPKLQAFIQNSSITVKDQNNNVLY